MTVTFTNRQGQTYYLHQGQSKSGKTHFYFSMESGDDLASAVPKGFEIYEHPNAQVYCRRIPQQFITTEERAEIERGIKQYAAIRYYIVDVRKKAIIIYTPSTDLDHLFNNLSTTVPGYSQQRARLANLLSYDPVMKFVLHDKRTRTFVAQRYCYRGSIDEWIDISHPTSLGKLSRKFLPHLEKESYFDLHLY